MKNMARTRQRQDACLTRRRDGRWAKKHKGKCYTFSGTKAEALAKWEQTLANLTTADARLVTTRRLSDLKPSPENQLYNPVTPESVADLVPEIRRDGVLEPLVITLDDYILSGHRRHFAARLAGLVEAPVRVHPIRRTDDLDEFVRLLVSFNDSRIKTLTEKVRESAVKIDPLQAYHRLVAQRAEKAALVVPTMDLGKRRARSKISDAKRPMLDACLKILRRIKRPVSDRKIHYELLNDPPLKNADKPASTYTNDAASYHNLTNLLTRARIEGIIPWSWICDETRPVEMWSVWSDPKPFIQSQLSDLFVGYYRDLMQSQPNHIEVLAEKNTVAASIRDVAAKYCLPLTSGRGFCSSLPRYQMAQRFRDSGKTKFVLLMISDLDPAGMAIAESFAMSLRDDFGVDEVQAIKVAITADQVKQYRIPHGEKAKNTRKEKGKPDGLRDEFVRRYGEYVYECEALPGTALSDILDDAIRSVLDLDAYNFEAEQEARDAAEIEATREAARELFRNL
jgi:hypothetical protein